MNLVTSSFTITKYDRDELILTTYNDGWNDTRLKIIQDSRSFKTKDRSRLKIKTSSHFSATVVALSAVSFRKVEELLFSHVKQFRETKHNIGNQRCINASGYRMNSDHHRDFRRYLLGLGYTCIWTTEPRDWSRPGYLVQWPKSRSPNQNTDVVGRGCQLSSEIQSQLLHKVHFLKNSLADMFKSSGEQYAISPEQYACITRMRALSNL